MPSEILAGSGSTLIRLPRTLVPSQSITAEANGTVTPGAANVTMVKARTMPSVAMSTLSKVVAKHDAQALRRSKNRAPQEVQRLATRWGWSASTR